MTASPWNATFEGLQRRTVASYERELIRHRRTERGLRKLSPRMRLSFAKRTS